MKVKTFFLIIILLAALGAGFYFGWVQFRLSEHTYGVIFTKTGGWDTETVKPGEFNWRWEGLIPTNMTLYRVPVRPQSVTVSREGTLPSGDTYAGVLENGGDFTYSMEFSLTYELKPQLLPQLVMDRGLEPSSLEEWYRGINREFMSAATRIASEELGEIDSARSEEISFTALEELLMEELSKDFPFVEFSAIQPKQLDIPDMDLYHAAKTYYLNVLEAKEKIEVETLEQKQSWMVSEVSKLDVLEKYGKLFTDYPGLVRYFALKETEEFKNLLPSVDLIEEQDRGAQEPSRQE